jgi:spore cortex formation protein SpoVR/YcgB (stage V sporulation)
MDVSVIHIDIPSYQFNTGANPFAFDAKDQKSISLIANKIEEALQKNFDMRNVLVRGIQSGHHNMMRDSLIDRIVKNGSDIYDIGHDSKDYIHAALYTDGIIEKLLDAFHAFKPKCEERPQYPVDIWMIFAAEKYSNIRYIHPRHKVLVGDRWKLKPAKSIGLSGILVIN